MLYWSPVPGSQTVPKAELHGLNLLCQHRSAKRLAIDASYVVSGAASQQSAPQGKDYQKLVQSPYGDTWRNIETSRTECHSYPEVVKVKGHTLYGDAATGKLSWADYIGNFLADISAHIAARLAQLPDSITAQVQRSTREGPPADRQLWFGKKAARRFPWQRPGRHRCKRCRRKSCLPSMGAAEGGGH